MPVTTFYIGLSGVLFAIGALGVLLRRNAIALFMCVELMLNAANLTLVAVAKEHGQLDGQIFVFFVMAVAAAEAAVGLAIFISVFRHIQSVSIDDSRILKG